MMRRIGIVATVLLAATLGPAAQEDGHGFVVVCPIVGLIDDGNAVFVERAVEEARGAEALILTIDTPGGLVDAAIEITQSLLSADCPTIAYIGGMGAISAGALISYSCDHIIMEPATNIGAATPVIASAEGMKPTSEKEVSFMRAKMRALAEEKKHNPSIAEAMVDKDIELRAYTNAEGDIEVVGAYSDGTVSIEDIASHPEKVFEDPVEVVRTVVESLPEELDSVKEAVNEALPEKPSPPSTSAPSPSLPPGVTPQTILPKGKLLTLTSNEAQEYGVIETTANRLIEVMSYYGCPEAEVRTLEMTWAERVFRFLSNPMVSGLLLMLGIGGLYLEFKTPGFGIPGIVGLTCLALFFGSHIVLGLADWVDLLLVLAGVILLVVEVLILPGFGIAGVAGILCLMAGIYLSLTNVAIPEYSWDFARLRDAGTSMLTTAVTLIAFIYVVWKALPYTPLYGKLILADAQFADSGYVVQTAEDETSAIGQHGVAVSMLRPAGRGRFGGKTLQVMSRSEYIDKGTPIIIVRVEGNRYVVDRLEEAQ